MIPRSAPIDKFAFRCTPHGAPSIAGEYACGFDRTQLYSDQRRRSAAWPPSRGRESPLAERYDVVSLSKRNRIPSSVLTLVRIARGQQTGQLI